MSNLINRSPFVFITDVVASVMASVFAMLFYRYYTAPIYNFDKHFFGYIALALAFSIAAEFITKTHKVLFKYAYFKSVAYLVKFVFVKIILLLISLLIFKKASVSTPFTLVITDFLFTLLALVLVKINGVVLQSGKVDILEEEKQEKAIKLINVAIFGTTAKSISAISRYQQSNRYNIVSIITRDKSLDGKILMDCKVVYCPDDLENLHIQDAEAILFPNHDEWKEEMDSLGKFCLDRGICILTLPGAESVNYPGYDFSDLKQTLQIKFIPDRMSGIERSFKRIVDFSIATLLIVLLSIPMLIISIIILINDGKPVLYKQERIGRFGRPFMIYKFRTMVNDAESFGPALYSGEEDPRLTRVGKFLRVHHLDEIPQLFNVFRGQMSFVGWRPERRVYIEKIIEIDPRYSYLYQIRPGVTSYATLKNGYADTLEKMVKRLQYDLYYLSHRSMFMDIKIIWLTAVNVFAGKKI